VWSASFAGSGEQTESKSTAITVKGKGTATKEFLETTTKKGKVETEITSTGNATINTTTKGGPQLQAMGVVSYPIPLAEHVTAVYRNEEQSATPESPCNGSVNAPSAEEGFLCVYTGGNFGSEEKQWKNAQFFTFEDPFGNFTSPIVTDKGGLLGELIVFRTKEFNEEEPIENIKSQSYLSTGGSWAVRAG